MNISFDKSGNGTGSEPVKPVVETQTVQTPAGDSVACTNTHTSAVQKSTGLLLGDSVPSFDQLILPRVNLVASVGQLKDSFTPGSFLYDTRVVLYVPPLINVKTSKVEREGTPPVIVTVLGFRPTRYVEKVPGGGKGHIAHTEAEVAANGGTLSWQEWNQKKASGIKLYNYLAEALLAIERPEACADDGTVFTFSVDGKQIALGLMSLKGSGYTVAKKSLFTPRSIGCLRDGYPTYSFALSSRLEPTPDKTSTYHLPVFVPNKRSSPAFLEFAQGVLAAPQVDQPDAE